MQICSLTAVAMSVGANRILPGTAIPFPVGNPALTLVQEKALRRKLVDAALEGLKASIDTQTIFDV